MPNNTDKDLLLHDPLNDVTRKERKYLLLTSMIGIAVGQAGLIPEEITTLGIKFAESDQKIILILLGLIVLYFLGAFVVYGFSDFLVWRKALHQETLNKKKEKHDDKKGSFKERIRIVPVNHYAGAIYILSKPISLIRAFFEFALPIIVGIYSVIVLWTS